MSTYAPEVPAPQVEAKEPTRARHPDEEGYVERDGVRLHYEVYGSGEPTFFFLPTWSLVHSRIWKMQLPYFGRHFRALTFDGRGNGKSDRPQDPAAYTPAEFRDDASAVLDATGTGAVITISTSLGTVWNLLLATSDPRVIGAVFIGPMYPTTQPFPPFMEEPYLETRNAYQDWEKYNVNYIREDLAGFLEFWGRKCCNMPHSSRGIENTIEWGLDTDAETVIRTFGPVPPGVGTIRELWSAGGGDLVRNLASNVRCPVLVVQGEHDLVTPHHWGEAVAKDTGGTLLSLPRAGHDPAGRWPVEFNLAVADFGTGGSGPQAGPDPTVHHSGDGRPRALFVSSPIGLGHARRDVAIAQELRKLVPGLEVDWLAQDPVTRVLEAEGERLHPLSEHLANESGHMESESAEHDLHCFHTFRRMDEILVANFMVWHDAVTEDRYDLWVADEGWDIDHFLHENPNLKNAPYAWLTDFVGFLPMEDADDYERFLTADYNEEMVEHIRDHPALRDRSIFVGNPDDIVPDRLGPNLPEIRDWTEKHFDFSGYITGFDPGEYRDREALRNELGYGEEEKVCIVTVGGSGVGAELLRKVIASFPEARRQVPELRMIVVAGPRIDPESLPFLEGLEVRPYVHQLYRHLAACDLAVVQGGLTTAMELTANKRPFLYFPLKHHFEQNFHVRHRLERYGAGRRMDFDESTPETIAAAIGEEIGTEVDYRDVETDGARRAAERLADML